MSGAGAKFGKYRIVRKLGEGAFGAVYEAVLPGPMGFTKRLAIKKLRSYLVADDPTFVQSMVNEARIGGLLHHDNIVDVVEFDQVDENYYIAMEFVDGLTLTEVVDICRSRQALLPRFATLKLAIDVCRGLHYAHEFRGADGKSLNLVHRDLKPSNIIVNDAGTAKVLDFGIAKAASNLFNTTASAMSKGTPRYMSPEQISCEGPLDRRSDLFSLGAVLFELVTGRVLFDSESLPGLALKIVGGLPEKDLDEAEVAFPGTREILAKALQKDREERFVDAQEVATALMGLSQQSPPQADMGEVIKRLIPARDLSRSISVKSTGDLNLAT
ncbi:MAG: serine/threonine-protein kinase, partial [Myxococcota bacterium]|nr:serine/threonine-protein kinase [Myxococcota bacterium]